MNDSWNWFVAPTFAFGAVAVLTPLVVRLAHRRGWVAEPQADRWHRTPTALMGGIAIFVAAALGWLWLAPSGPLLWIAVAGAILFVAGFMDDRVGLSPLAKVGAQVAGAGVLLAGGLSFTPGWPLWISVPFTLFWVVGITNAVNLLDNMDGVAAGVSTIAAAALAAVAWTVGHAEVAVGALVLAAAAGGFLLYNFNPARTFMGDCGSLFLGISLAGLAMAAPQGATVAGVTVVPVVAALILAVPVLDTTLVTISRVCVGRGIAQGGKDHTSHRLVRTGLAERTVALALYGVGIISGIAGWGALASDLGPAMVLLSGVTLAFFVFGRFLYGIHVYGDESAGRGTTVSGGSIRREG